MARAFVIKRDANGQYHFNLRDDNNEIILRASETYMTKQGCKDGIASVRVHSPHDINYTRYSDRQIHPTFNLKSYNNQIIGVGESYNTTQARETGILNVKICAGNAVVMDEA